MDSRQLHLRIINHFLALVFEKKLAKLILLFTREFGTFRSLWPWVKRQTKRSNDVMKAK